MKSKYLLQLLKEGILDEKFVKDNIDKILLLDDSFIEELLTKDTKLALAILYYEVYKENMSEDVRKIFEQAIQEENSNIYYILGLLEQGKCKIYYAAGH